MYMNETFEDYLTSSKHGAIYIKYLDILYYRVLLLWWGGTR